MKLKYFRPEHRSLGDLDFLYEIGQITGVNVPEPSTYVAILGLLSLAIVTRTKR